MTNLTMDFYGNAGFISFGANVMLYDARTKTVLVETLHGTKIRIADSEFKKLVSISYMEGGFDYYLFMDNLLRPDAEVESMLNYSLIKEVIFN